MVDQLGALGLFLDALVPRATRCLDAAGVPAASATRPGDVPELDEDDDGEPE